MVGIKGKVALVTGAGRGIGRAVAVALAQEDLHVAVNYATQTEEAAKTCSLAQEFGVRCFPFKADVSLSSEVSRMVAAVEQELGPVLVLVNNAGIVHQGSLENLREEDWDRVMAVNLKSAFLVTQAVLPAMHRAGWGRNGCMTGQTINVNGGWYFSGHRSPRQRRISNACQCP